MLEKEEEFPAREEEPQSEEAQVEEGQQRRGHGKCPRERAILAFAPWTPPLSARDPMNRGKVTHSNSGGIRLMTNARFIACALFIGAAPSGFAHDPVQVAGQAAHHDRPEDAIFKTTPLRGGVYALAGRAAMWDSWSGPNTPSWSIRSSRTSRRASCARWPR